MVPSVAFLVVLLFCATTPEPALGVAPVHQNFTKEFYQTVRQRRHLRSNQYRPLHVAPSHCWFLSDDVCKRDDEAAGKAKHERRLVNVGNNLKVMVLLVRFSDHEDKELPNPSYFEEFFNGDNPEVDRSSVRQYLKHSSLVSDVRISLIARISSTSSSTT